ncbi:MAG: hypothetical protein L3K17_01480 [Thermoplasmata archaeon]|nr:hypothetical protein [Thermoplasmata archaeon]
MGIPIEVPGLDTILPDLGTGRVIVAESGADPAKSFFVRRMGLTAMKLKLPFTIVTSRDREEVQEMMLRESGAQPWVESELSVIEEDSVTTLEPFAGDGGLLAVDSFSFLTLDLSGTRIAKLLREVRYQCRAEKTTVLLGTDRGMADARSEAVAAHLADGVIQFHAREGPEGLIRFLRVPKWTDGKFVDRNIYYSYDGNRIAVDLRRRVL